mgnify:CR=1 FL=1
MKIIDRSEYFIVLKLFVIDFTGLYLYYDIFPFKSKLNTYFISIYILSLYYFYCIFIQSEFDSKLIQLLQIRLLKIKLLASFNRNKISIYFITLIFIYALLFYRI